MARVAARPRRPSRLLLLLLRLLLLQSGLCAVAAWGGWPALPRLHDDVVPGSFAAWRHFERRAQGRTDGVVIVREAPAQAAGAGIVEGPGTSR
jgi:hypothetical protein